MPRTVIVDDVMIHIDNVTNSLVPCGNNRRKRVEISNMKMSERRSVRTTRKSIKIVQCACWARPAVRFHCVLKYFADVIISTLHNLPINLLSSKYQWIVTPIRTRNVIVFFLYALIMVGYLLLICN